MTIARAARTKNPPCKNGGFFNEIDENLLKINNLKMC